MKIAVYVLFFTLTAVAWADDKPLLQDEDNALVKLVVDRNKPLAKRIETDKYNNTRVYVTLYVDREAGCGRLDENSKFLESSGDIYTDIKLYTIAPKIPSTCEGYLNSSRPVTIEIFATDNETYTIANEVEVLIHMTPHPKGPHYKSIFDSAEVRYKTVH
jgi:hypothetical protein